MTAEELQVVKEGCTAGLYTDAALISELIADLEYSLADGEKASAIIAKLRAELAEAGAEIHALAYRSGETAEEIFRLENKVEALQGENSKLQRGLDKLARFTGGG